MTARTIIDAGERHIRDINRDIQKAAAAGNPVTVVNTLSRHNLGVGLPPGADIRFEGSVGYYCGGLNTGCLLYTSPSPRDQRGSRMPSSA